MLSEAERALASSLDERVRRLEAIDDERMSRLVQEHRVLDMVLIELRELRLALRGHEATKAALDRLDGIIMRAEGKLR